MIRKWIILFDWDGTLIDSLDLKIRNAGALFEQALGIPPDKVEEVYRQHSGLPRRQVFQAICQENGLKELEEAEFDNLSRRFSEVNLALFTDPGRTNLVVPETRRALGTLTKCGYPLYVSSSAETEELRTIAQAHGLDGFFQKIMGSRPGFNKGKEHIDFVLQKQSANKNQIVFVGDEPFDIIIGQEAGVLTIAKVGTYSAERLSQSEPNYVVASLGEIPGILERIDGREED